ncbi:MAG TPA: DUF4260 domain-containing protein [Chitinophagaceae bacterium]|nr:DUF4260 domain-containing protein [Chitinophagaceae bacterium]
MKNTIRLEELAMLGLSVYALSQYHAAWWWYLLLIIGPDISMIGYLGGNKTGAFLYNLFHHKGIAVAALIAGFILPIESVLLIGIVLFGHSSMDRFFGYGLKTEEGFKYTHLGMIGKK